MLSLSYPGFPTEFLKLTLSKRELVITSDICRGEIYACFIEKVLHRKEYGGYSWPLVKTSRPWPRPSRPCAAVMVNH